MKITTESHKRPMRYFNLKSPPKPNVTRHSEFKNLCNPNHLHTSKCRLSRVPELEPKLVSVLGASTVSRMVRDTSEAPETRTKYGTQLWNPGAVWRVMQLTTSNATYRQCLLLCDAVHLVLHWWLDVPYPHSAYIHVVVCIFILH